MLKAFNSKRKKGFTLIELLVVIAILGILVLLAAPRFLRYTKDANVATMQADVKVLSNAALVYNTENEGAWPIDSKTPVATVTQDGKMFDVFAIDEGKLSSQVQSIKNDYSDYGIAIDSEVRDAGGDVMLQDDGTPIANDKAGSVYYIGNGGKGLEDKDGKTLYGVSDDISVAPHTP